jgi:hypothetical protein
MIEKWLTPNTCVQCNWECSLPNYGNKIDLFNYSKPFVNTQSCNIFLKPSLKEH